MLGNIYWTAARNSTFGRLAGRWGLQRTVPEERRPSVPRAPIGIRDCGMLVLLVAIVALTWCAHYDLWSQGAWRIPVNYVGGRYWDMVFTGDASWGMAATKAMKDGEIFPILPKYPKSLGAPFGANWNDWPTFEEAINTWWAFLASCFGLFTGSNIALLSAHLLAAVTFYSVCRHLRYTSLFSLMGAALFALSRYAFWRNLPNLQLTFYWHVPLGLLVAWWCIREESIAKDRRKVLLCIAVAVIHGVQSAYYSGLFMQLLFWATVYCVWRWHSWRRAILPVSLGAVLFATVALMNVDTFYSWLGTGANLAATARGYFDLERYALKPIELFLPLSHSFSAFQQWSDEVYFTRTLIPTEQGSAYLGVVAMLGLILLFLSVAIRIATRNSRRVPPHFWCLCLVLSFSAVGGLNGMVGLFGFRLFRSSNRYSVVVFTVLLLFLVRQLTLMGRKWSVTSRAMLATSLVAVGIYDQVPPRQREVETAARRAWIEDHKLVAAMEQKLPAGAMIFQLPVHDFPEAYLIGKMDDYEQFRPYLHSRDLRFSYGEMKGRYEARWQKEVQQMGPEAGLKLVEKYGFSAVLIDRNGYDDRGASLLDALASLGRSRVIAQTHDFVCVALNPLRRPILPPVFAEGWYPLQGNYGYYTRGRSGNARLALRNATSVPIPVRLSFRLSALNGTTVDISNEGGMVYQAVTGPDGGAVPVRLTLTLQPGENALRFASRGPADLELRDATPEAFRLVNLRLLE